VSGIDGAALRRVALLVLDVDGVMTDGTLYYGPEGESQKQFHVHDGAGIKAARAAGIEVAVITGRGGPAVKARLAELGVEQVVMGCENKWPALQEIISGLGLGPREVAYLGDDLADRECIASVGFGCAVANARPEVKRAAAWVTRSPGGAGARAQEQIGEFAHRSGAGFRVVIPARFDATRLPGKPLRMLGGEPMIVRVWRAAMASSAEEVIVAADDPRIVEAVTAAGGLSVLTRKDHTSGTDRIAEVASARGFESDSIVVNLQGDEPFMEPRLVDRVAQALADDPLADIATIATPISRPAELFDSSLVKVVCNGAGRALYFSRAPVPWVRGEFDRPGAVETLPDGIPFLRHVGLYAYRCSAIEAMTRHPPSAAERAESLEQLRALDLGFGVHVSTVENVVGHGIDTEEDLRRAVELLARNAG